MKYFFPFVIAVSLLFLSCSKAETPSKCIKESAKDFCHNESCNKGVKVEQYKFQNKLVYVFDSGICGADMTSEVMNSECDNLGYLGGISGNSMINGEDFSNADYIKTIRSKF